MADFFSLSGVIKILQQDKRVKRATISPVVKSAFPGSFYVADVQFQTGNVKTNYSEHVSEMKRSKSPRVIVREYPISLSIEQSNFLGEVGESIQLKVIFSDNVIPEKIIDITWISENPEIVNVSKDGVATIYSQGLTTVYVIATYNNHQEVSLYNNCIIGTSTMPTNNFIQSLYNALLAKGYYPEDITEEAILATMEGIARAPIIRLSVVDSISDEYGYEDSVSDAKANLVTLETEETFEVENFNFNEEVSTLIDDE